MDRHSNKSHSCHGQALRKIVVGIIHGQALAPFRYATKIHGQALAPFR
jgi:hypothetical protein